MAFMCVCVMMLYKVDRPTRANNPTSSTNSGSSSPSSNLLTRGCAYQCHTCANISTARMRANTTCCQDVSSAQHSRRNAACLPGVTPARCAPTYQKENCRRKWVQASRQAAHTRMSQLPQHNNPACSVTLHILHLHCSCRQTFLPHGSSIGLPDA